MSRTLPVRPNLEHLKKQAKALLRGFAAGDPEAVAAFGARPRGAPLPKLAEAQRALAHLYGLPSWAQLRQHVESLTGRDPALALEAAIQLDDAARVRDVLARFPAIRSRLDAALPNAGFGETPLIAAANRRNREMIEVLLDAGANVNQRSHWWAGGFGVLGDDPEINALLIDRGARVDAHDAARLGMFDRLRALVEETPDVVRARFGDGQTPLHVAATVEIAAWLLDHGAEIDALDVDHESTPAQYLIGEHQDVVRLLVERGCRTDLLMACALGDPDLVRRHLDADPASIAMTVSPRWFPMRNPHAGGCIYIWSLGNRMSAHGVARRFKREAVLALLDERATLPIRLAAACDAEDAGAVESLLRERGAPALDGDAATASRIVDAAQRDSGQAVALFVRAGWPASVRNESGATALHWAAFHGNAVAVRALLAGGADRTLLDPMHHNSPLGWAEFGADHSWRREHGDYPAVLEALRS